MRVTITADDLKGVYDQKIADIMELLGKADRKFFMSWDRQSQEDLTHLVCVEDNSKFRYDLACELVEWFRLYGSFAKVLEESNDDGSFPKHLKSLALEDLGNPFKGEDNE